MQKRGRVVFLLLLFALLPIVSASFLGDVFSKFTGQIIKEEDLRYEPEYNPFQRIVDVDREVILDEERTDSSIEDVFLVGKGESCVEDADCESGSCGEVFVGVGESSLGKVCHNSRDTCAVNSLGLEVNSGYAHCSGSQAYRICSPWDEESDWSELFYCGAGEVCEAGLGCVEAESCSSGSFRCTDKNSLEKCEEGVWKHQADCWLDYGQKCEQNSCVDYSNVECRDTDEGDNFVQGRVYLDGVLEGEDRCYSEGSKYLIEYDCYSEQKDINMYGAETKKVVCEDGCYFGACIDLPEHTCIKEGGEDVYSKGRVIIDSEYSYYDSCHTEDYVLEGKCGLDNNFEEEKIFCHGGCLNGACIEVDSGCFDSDGEDFFVKGEVGLAGGEVYTDSCVTDLSLREFYCQGDGVREKEVNCENGCKYGVCLESSCVDSDGGLEVNEFGVAEYFVEGEGFRKSNDYCYDSTHVYEGVCVDGKFDRKYLECPDYCVGGVCEDYLYPFEFSSQVLTEKDKYVVGEQIDLSGNSPTINSNSIKQFAKSIEESKHVQESDFSGEVKRYIVEFEEPSVLEEFAIMKKKAEINEGRFISSVPILKNLIITNDNLDSKIDQYAYSLDRNSQRLKNKIGRVVEGAPEFISGRVVDGGEKKIVEEYKYSFYGVGIEADLSVREELEEIDGVKAVYEDRVSSATSYETTELLDLSYVWGMDKYGQDCYLSGSECLRGEGIKIAILDTGVDYTHSDLGGCFGEGCKVSQGWDFVNSDGDPLDDNGHGTHVASIAAGKGGVDGIAPDAEIHAYKVLDDFGNGWNSQILLGIEASIDPNGDGDFSDGADVLSLSLGGEGNPGDFLSNAVNRVSSFGIPVIVAAGNAGDNPMTINSPGVAREAITVGSASASGKVATYSSRGEVIWQNEVGEMEVLAKPDLVGYGSDVCAAKSSSINLNSDEVSCVQGEYIVLSGTSMATPQVSGLVALIRQKNKDLSPGEIKDLLKNYAEDLGEDYSLQGAGAISARNIFGEDNSQFVLDKYYVDVGAISGEKPGEIKFSIKNNLDYSVSLEVGGVVEDGEILRVEPSEVVLAPYAVKEVSIFLEVEEIKNPFTLKEAKIVVKNGIHEKELKATYYVEDAGLVGSSFFRGAGIKINSKEYPISDFFDYDFDGDLDGVVCYFGSCYLYENLGDRYVERHLYKVAPLGGEDGGSRSFSVVKITHGDINSDGYMDISFSGLSGKIFVLYGGSQTGNSENYVLSVGDKIGIEDMTFTLLRSTVSEVNPGQAVFGVEDLTFTDSVDEIFNGGSFSGQYTNDIFYRDVVIYVDEVLEDGRVKVHVERTGVNDDYLGYFGGELDSSLVDYDLDGDLDIVFGIIDGAFQNFYVLEYSQGDFGERKLIYDMGYDSFTDFEVVDYDLDGDLDILYLFFRDSNLLNLVVVEDFMKSSSKKVFLNGFQTLYHSGYVKPIEVGDYDLDGDLDIVIGAGDGAVYYLEREGEDYLEEVLLNYYESGINGLNSVDFNLDGKEDLFVSIDSGIYYKENFNSREVSFERVSKLKNIGEYETAFDLVLSLQKKSGSSWTDQKIVGSADDFVLGPGEVIALGLNSEFGWNKEDVYANSPGSYRVYLEVGEDEGREYFDSYEFLVE